MNTTTTIIIIAIAVILIAIAVISKHHKHQRVFHTEEIATAVNKTFADAGTNEMDRTAFLKAFQLKMNCSHKELMFLLGKALTAGLIIVDGKRIKLVS